MCVGFAVTAAIFSDRQQILTEPEKVTEPKSMTVWLMRWYPSLFELGPREEINIPGEVPPLLCCIVYIMCV
jgi:hypothetical protein